MQDASEKSMKECKEKYADHAKPVVVGPGETADQAMARVRAPLIKMLLDSKCCAEPDRLRLEKMDPKGLVAELCGCECNGYFPYAHQDRGGEPGTLDPSLTLSKP